MSRKANSTAIGLFVVSSAVSVVLGVAYFGSGRFLAETKPYVLFFEGSLKGLNKGAPVLLRGVKIGEVTDVVVRYHVDNEEIDIPVYIKVRPDSIIKFGGVYDSKATAQLLVEQGLRATLISQSFVTGLLAIQLEFHPNTPIRLVGGDPGIPELPTIPSKMEELSESFGDFVQKMAALPIDGLVADLREAVQGINELVRSEDIKKAIVTLNDTLEEFGTLARNIDEQVDPLSSAVQSTLKTVDEKVVSLEGTLGGTLDSFKELAEDIDGQVDPLSTSITDAAATAQAALEQARQTLATVEQVIAKDSELHYRLMAALDEFSGMAHSLRVLADYLEQHPEALLQGKRAPGGQ